MLARWRPWLSEFDFDIAHVARIKGKAEGDLLGTETKGEDSTDVNYDISFAITNVREDKDAKTKVSVYTVCHISDH